MGIILLRPGLGRPHLEDHHGRDRIPRGLYGFLEKFAPRTTQVLLRFHRLHLHSWNSLHVSVLLYRGLGSCMYLLATLYACQLRKQRARRPYIAGVQPVTRAGMHEPDQDLNPPFAKGDKVDRLLYQHG